MCQQVWEKSLSGYYVVAIIKSGCCELRRHLLTLFHVKKGEVTTVLASGTQFTVSNVLVQGQLPSWRSWLARQSHNLKVVSSSLTEGILFFVCLI